MLSSIKQRIVQWASAPAAQPEWVDVDVPETFAWVDRQAYQQGYNDELNWRLENPYPIGSLKHVSWKHGAERRANVESSIW